MRKADRQRASMRRTHQLGESDTSYAERVRITLEECTGLRVAIDKVPRGFTIRGYQPGEVAPSVRVERRSLEAAIQPFADAARTVRDITRLGGKAAINTEEQGPGKC